MIRFQERDIEVLTLLGKCGLASYSQICKNYFPTPFSCRKRVGRLKQYEYIKGAYFNTTEKVFALTKEGALALKDITGSEPYVTDYRETFHKLARTEAYLNITKRYNITNWEIEYELKDTNNFADAIFYYGDKTYILEVWNEQHMKPLRERLMDYTKIRFPFILILYTKNKTSVKKLLEKVTIEEPFKTMRKYRITLYEYGEDVEL